MKKLTWFLLCALLLSFFTVSVFADETPGTTPTPSADPSPTSRSEEETTSADETMEDSQELYDLTLKKLKYMKDPDYSKRAAWYHRDLDAEYDCDVFFLLPTVWHRHAGQSLICDISSGLSYVISDAVEYTANAFKGVANIYIPYYRQIDASYVLRQSSDYVEKLLSLASVPDVYAALDQYFAKYNNGRPFILAGHSQGSQILLRVLSDYMSIHPEYMERMVACYIVGYSVTQDFMDANPSLTFSNGPYDTGVILSWNTEAAGVTENNPAIAENALCINPISFTRSTEYVSASSSCGSYLNGERVECFADAMIDEERGCVICTTADPTLYATSSTLFPEGTFHTYDYAFYYYDIRVNASYRIMSWLLQHSD